MAYKLIKKFSGEKIYRCSANILPLWGKKDKKGFFHVGIVIIGY